MLPKDHDFALPLQLAIPDGMWLDPRADTHQGIKSLAMDMMRVHLGVDGDTACETIHMCGPSPTSLPSSKIVISKTYGCLDPEHAVSLKGSCTCYCLR